VTPGEFTKFCGDLLLARGFKLVPLSRRARDIGTDFIVKPSGSEELWAVECKYVSPALPNSSRRIHEASSQAITARDSLGGRRALVITNAEVPEAVHRNFDIVGGEIWDFDLLLREIETHPELWSFFNDIRYLNPPNEDPVAKALSLAPRAAELATKLAGLPSGRGTWRDFEDLCIEILNYVFIPPFRTPDIQSRSEDGLDRRDAIYPLTLGNPIWDRIQSECKSRMVVAEFKNYGDPPSQKEVESIEQYLFPKAMRSFGIVCARKEPDASALKARRRAWLHRDVLIVFLSDESLRNLLLMRAANENPAQVIDDQIDEFFRRLCP
jgi:hypothetical protein